MSMTPASPASPPTIRRRARPRYKLFATGARHIRAVRRRIVDLDPAYPKGHHPTTYDRNLGDRDLGPRDEHPHPHDKPPVTKTPPQSTTPTKSLG